MKIPDGGAPDPVSQYDYSHMSVAQLEYVLGTKPGDVQNVQNGWQSFAANLSSALDDGAFSLTAILKLLDGWSGDAAQAIKDRATQIHAFGGQVVEAAKANGEAFNQAGQTFHVATDLLGYSIGDMNQQLGFVQQARDDWSMDLCEALSTMVSARGPSTEAYQGLKGAIEWRPIEGRAYPSAYTFDYWYGYGLPGLVHFWGAAASDTGIQLHGDAGPYGQPYQLIDPGWFYGDTVGKSFPSVYQNQLQLLLKQVGGSSYAPQVGKFPKAPRPTWTSASTTLTTPTNNFGGGPGSFNGGGTGGGVGGKPPGSTGGTGGGGLPGGGLGGGAGGGSGGGGLPGGGTGGTGGGGLPGGGTGGTGPFPTGGTGGGGMPGGGPGGYGGGGVPTGGGTKLAGPIGPGTGGLPIGPGPGGVGGIGPIGGSGGLGLPGGGLGGAGSLGGGGSDGLPALGSAATGAAAEGALGSTAATGSAMPMMPPMMPPMAGAGQNDNSRQRKSWLPDDDDIWGDDSAAVPPVISSSD